LSTISETICDWICYKLPKTELTEANLQQVRTHYVKQAASELFRRHCISMVIGDAVTEQALRDNEGFFDGSSATRDVVICYLQECADCESSFASTHLDDLLRLFSFANVFNWPEEHSRKPHPDAKVGQNNHALTMKDCLKMVITTLTSPVITQKM